MCGAFDPLRADAPTRVDPSIGPPDDCRVGGLRGTQRRRRRSHRTDRRPVAHRLVGSQSSLSATAMEHQAPSSSWPITAGHLHPGRPGGSLGSGRIYDALLAGLATLAGPLHGGASQHAHELLGTAERDDAARALNGALAFGGTPPGWATAYTGGDPRFARLLPWSSPS